MAIWQISKFSELTVFNRTGGLVKQIGEFTITNKMEVNREISSFKSDCKFAK